MLRWLHDTGRSATATDQAILARWSGWGSLPQVFDERASGWDAERAEVRALLDEAAWNAARTSTVNAHYTDASLVRVCWNLLTDLGFTGGRVLEPGCGSGNFLGLAPDIPLDLVGVEVEPTTAAIAAALYPHARILSEGFEETRLPAGSFDAAIGNVPFGNYPLHDPLHNPRGHTIHNHFAIKALDLLKPGGVLVTITSPYTMDARNPGARRDMYERADLLGAVRLPSNAHMAAAGTSVVTDILVLRRRPVDEPRAPFGWETTAEVDLPADSIQPDLPDTIRVNRYFAEHPDRVLGRYGVGGVHATTVTVTAADGWVDRLAVQARQIAASAKEAGRGWSPLPPEPTGPAPPGTARPDEHDGEVGALTLVNGTLSILGRDGQHRTVGTRNKREAEELRALIDLRDTTRAVLAAQTSDDPADAETWQAERQRLNTIYDRYVSRFGRLADVRTVAPGTADQPPAVTPRVPARILDDPGWPLLAALEVVDHSTGQITKAAIFEERVIAPRREPTGATTAAEALSLCLATYGRADLHRIAGLLGIDEDSALAELGDLVYELLPSPATPASPGTELPLSAPAADAEQRIEIATAYLSGNVRRKLEVARTAAQADPRWDRNVTALEKVLPRDLTPEEIGVQLGAPWLPAEIIGAFVGGLLDIAPPVVHHSEKTATWEIDIPGHRRGQLVTAVSKWGTRRVNAVSLIEQMLNMKPTVVYDEDDDGKRIRNIVETVAANNKRDQIAEQFARWAWEYPSRAAHLSRLYNDRFNCLVLPTFDGSHMTFPGMSTAFTPHPHQRDAAWRIVSGGMGERGGNVLLGHVVGAGKTATMIMAGQEMRRLGLVNKPMYVVPNHMLEQFGREFIQLYPNAKVLLAQKSDLGRDARQAFAARAATGNWDAIVIKQSSFGMLRVSPEIENEFLENEGDAYRALLQELAMDREKNRFTVKELEKAVLKFTTRLKTFAERRQDPGLVTFDMFGVDYLFVDEADMYKGLRIVTKLPISAPASERAFDLCMKLDWLRQTYGSRVATFATGTPIANSLSELWVMLRYLAPELLTEMKIEHFDSWAATFARTVTGLELAPEGGSFRVNTRYAAFDNVPELLALYRTVVDLKTADDIRLPVPALHSGKPVTATVPGSDELHDCISELGERAEEVRAGKVDPKHDNMLKISNEGRLASLDLRLVGRPPDPAGGKISVCAQRIADLWHEHAADLFTDADGRPHATPGACQVIFCDQGTPTKKEGRFTVYNALRDLLMDRGIPRERIAFVHDHDTDAAKARLFAACRDGQINIIIGSTGKMGVGTNIQRRLVALHHLDVPWRPADIEQREGRILRQGNQCPEVHIIRYITEGSFDAYMWQAIERKARFITQIMAGKTDVRTIDDLNTDQVLSYAEIKALATGSPLVVQAAALDMEITRLRRLATAHAHEQADLAASITSDETRLAATRYQADRVRQLITARRDTRGEAFTAMIDRKWFDDRATAGTHFIDQARLRTKDRYLQDVTLGTIGNIPVIARRLSSSLEIRVDGAPDNTINIDFADDAADPGRVVVNLEKNIRRLDTILNNLDTTADRLSEEITKARALKGQPFPQRDQLNALVHERDGLTKQLEQLGRKKTPVSTVVAKPEGPLPAHLTL